ISQYHNASLCRNTISPYRKANLPIIAMPQFNIAIPQGKSSNYRYTAIQYRYNTRLLSPYRKARLPIIAMPQYNKKTYIYKQRREPTKRGEYPNTYRNTAIRLFRDKPL